jgi:hypothetical protein
MNGRVYDPWLGRFLSPDPFVQAPTYSQNYNRYSYALNNPLKYIDPSGYYYGPAKDIIDDGYYDLAGQSGMNYLGGVNNVFYSTSFANSGFTEASTETMTTVSYDENRIPIYEYKQVLVYKDKSGNMIGYQEYAEKKESNDDSENGEKQNEQEIQSDQDWPTNEDLEKDFANSYEVVVIKGYVNNENYNPINADQFAQDILYSGDLNSDKHYFVLVPVEARIDSYRDGRYISNEWYFIDPYYDNGLPTVYGRL